MQECQAGRGEAGLAAGALLGAAPRRAGIPVEVAGAAAPLLLIAGNQLAPHIGSRMCWEVCLIGWVGWASPFGPGFRAAHRAAGGVSPLAGFNP